MEAWRYDLSITDIDTVYLDDSSPITLYELGASLPMCILDHVEDKRA